MQPGEVTTRVDEIRPATGTDWTPTELRPARGRVARRLRSIREFPWRDYPRLTIGLVVLLVLVATAILAPLIAPYSPVAIDSNATLEAPSAAHVLGADQFGRDTLSRLIFASRVSLLVGLIAVSIGLVGGVLIGVVSAYYGRSTDMVLMRIMDILYSFPAILLAIAVMAGLGTSVVNAMIAIGIIFIPGFARVARTSAEAVLRGQFIEAARTIGMSDRRILLREILPNIRSQLITQAALALAFAIVVEAALSFMGLGTQPPDPSWGNMINEGRGFLRQAPWLTVVPGAGIFLAVLAFNLIGDGLRDYFDPRMRQ